LAPEHLKQKKARKGLIAFPDRIASAGGRLSVC